MKDKRRRMTIFHQLREEVQRVIDPDGSLDCAVFDMVRGCADYSDGVEDLILAVAHSEKGSIPMGRVWAELPAIMGFPDPEIHETIADALKITGEQIDREVMETAFKDSISAQLRAELGIPGVASMCRWRMLKETESLPQGPDGRFPFADFICRLLPSISQRQIGPILLTWASHVSGESVASLRRKAESGAPPSDKDAARPHLVVRLVPHPIDQDRYKAVFYLHRETECRSFPTERGEDDPGVSIEEVGNKLDAFLNDFDDEGLPRAVEVMAPCDRLSALKPAPHLWKLQEGRRRKGAPLGRKYPVYLRLDRHENGGEKIAPDLRRDWKTKWREFSDATTPADVIHWECDPSACDYDVLEPRLCRPGTRPCLILAFEPDIQPDDPWLADILLETGIPVALWGDGEKGDIESLLEPLLNGGSLRDLPAHIWNQRRGNPNTDPENAALPHLLTLLWDNPDRDIHGRRTAPETPTYFDDSSI
jgi:hypothetical protein